jgi:hypothetical protein
MGRDRVVKPRTERLPLSDGDWIEVKRQLNHGEREDLLATMAESTEDGGQRLDRRIFRRATVLAYLVGWSFESEGQPLAYSPLLSELERDSLLRSLDQPSFEELYQAVVRHERAIDVAVATLKKTPDGPNNSDPISPSPFVADGALTGSVR